MLNTIFMDKTADLITGALLSWYDNNRRVLPWRTDGDRQPDPYHVWLSEVMLQQTTVATVKPRFLKFLERWPRISKLAAASLEDVLHEWQGLGYYARARNLHLCAQTIHRDHGGIFPSTENELKALPGIGDYTAAAIAAIAFGEVTAPVDGNIIRVISRLDAIDDAMPKGKRTVQRRVEQLVSHDRPGDFAQAMMDLGAGVCAPRRPDCRKCPWAKFCTASREGSPADYPRKSARKEKPTRFCYVFWIQNDRGDVYLRRRPPKGLLGGMMEFPSSDWCENAEDWKKATETAPTESTGAGSPKDVIWNRLDGEIVHTFTHFHLRLTVLCTTIDGHGAPGDGYWSRPDDFHEYALPTVMKKVAAFAKTGGNNG